MTICVHCSERPLASRIEEQSEACGACIPKLLKHLGEELDATRRESNDTRMILEGAQEKIRILEGLNDLKLQLAEAEDLGGGAAEVGVASSENPYPDGSDTANFWEIGWTVQNIIMDMERVRAFVLWLMEHMAVIRDIAKGTGNDELASKVDQLFEKTVTVFDDLLEPE